MKKTILTLAVLTCFGLFAQARDWDAFPVPADAGSGNTWQLQTNISDEFNYTMSEGNRPAEFTNKWNTSFINGWTGPGSTIFNSAQVWSSGTQLAIQARSAGGGKSYNGIISSKNKIKYPIYMEIRAKIMNLTLANAFWTVNDNSTQEIDIMEGYGASTAGIDGSDQSWFANRMHLSHHTFIRSPFTDYQPMDAGSWHYSATPWRSDYHRYGCYWKDPWTLEYYIDGVKVRTVSGASMIDPNNNLGGTGLNSSTNIIIDCENQTDWRPAATVTELNDDTKDIFWVDWVRFYKPVAASNPGGGNTTTISGNSSVIQAESLNSTGGTFADGKVTGGGVNVSSSTINYVNAGDWAEYAINATENATYQVVYSISTPMNNAQVRIKCDGTTISTDNVVNNGQWDSYQDLIAANNLSLTTGNHTIRIEASGSNNWQWNMDKITLNKVTGSSSGGSSTGTVITVEAESFTSTGGTYNDGNVPLGANKSNTTINWVNNGDWMDYAVNVPAAGTYNVSYQISSPITGSTIQISSGGSSVTTTVPNNGQWDNYVTLNASGAINLSAGNQTIRLTAGGQTWTWNLDKFTLTYANKSAKIISSELSDLKLYPNPVNNELNVILTGEVQQKAKLMIYQATGNLVRTESVQYNEFQINTNNLASGMYLLKVINGSKTNVKSFIKQ